MSDTRFVPITREQYDVLANLFVAFAGTPVFPVWESELVEELCDAWESAPADPAEAVAAAIDSWAHDADHNRQFSEAQCVLRALGVPHA